MSVKDVVVDSSAARSFSLFPGDEIVAVGGRPVVGKTAEEVNLLIEGEEGTAVELEYRPAGVKKGTERVELVRRRQSSEPFLADADDRQKEEARTEDEDCTQTGQDEAASSASWREASREDLEAMAVEIRNGAEEYHNRLREAVSFASVSVEGGMRGESERCVTWLSAWLSALQPSKLKQVQGSLREGSQREGSQREGAKAEKPPPPALVASFEGASASSLLVHLHYDVRPAYWEDGWSGDPFLLEHNGSSGELIGRIGGKADALAWLWAIEAYQKRRLKLPLTVHVLIEGAFELCSETLASVLDEIAVQPEHVALCASFNPLDAGPALVLGCRGLLFLTFSVSKPRNKSPAGLQSVTQAALTLIQRTMGPGDDTWQGSLKQHEETAEGAEVREAACSGVGGKEEFSMSEVMNAQGAAFRKELIGDDGELDGCATLRARWHQSCVTLHDVTIRDQESGPVQVSLGVRLVGDMRVNEIESSLRDFLSDELAAIDASLQLEVSIHQALSPTSSSSLSSHSTLSAARAAIDQCHPINDRGAEPDTQPPPHLGVFDGSTIPAASILHDKFPYTPLAIIATAGPKCGAALNESRQLRDYVGFIELFARYMMELGASSVDSPHQSSPVALRS